MKKDLTSQEFLDDLKDVKNVISSLSGQSDDLKTSVEKVQNYIEKAGTVEGQESLYNIIRDLSTGMRGRTVCKHCLSDAAWLIRQLN
jgi:hypothetical protein